jgi:hypothetical protein
LVTNSAGSAFSIAKENVLCSYYYSSTFFQVPGVPGAAFATFYEEYVPWDYTGAPSGTYVTFDNGGRWHPMSMPPEVYCNRSAEHWDHCTLNLANRQDLYGDGDAPGIILASARVGPSYSYPTFLTRDAGLHWREIWPNATNVYVGDRGSLLVLADFYSRRMAYMHWSWDGGATFRSCVLSEKYMYFGGFTKSNASGEVLYIAGYGGDVSGGQLFRVSFANEGIRNCTEQDFEVWWENLCFLLCYRRVLMRVSLQGARRRQRQRLCAGPTDEHQAPQGRRCMCRHACGRWI